MSSLEEIQITLAQLYKKNILYLQNNNKALYSQIIEFEQLNIENYFIDFIDNHFELLDKDGKKTYNCDPFYDAQYRAKNLKNDNFLTLIRKDDKLNDQFHYNNHINAYEQINKYLTFLDEEKDIINFPINKFIFIGTILGVHINDIHDKIEASTYLIIEPNIEIFRLSLFLTDYAKLCEDSKVFFCIGFTDSFFNESIKDFLSYNYKYNTHIQFELSSKNELDLVNKVSLEILENSEMTYPYSEYIISMKRGYDYCNTSYNGIVNLNQLKNVLPKKPILYLGAGPSLSQNIIYLAEHQNKFIIVAASASLKRLETVNIIPDIIITIDAKKGEILKQFDVNKKYYKDSIILASIKTDEDIVKIIDSPSTFFMQDSFELFEGYGTVTGINVGDIGISLLLKLGVEELYLLGFDAAINSQTGESYDSLHSSNKKIDLEHQGTTYVDHVIMVKGNFQKEVPTFIYYKTMIDNIAILLDNTTVSISNLSDGAYFKNTIPLKVTDINPNNFTLIDKSNLKNELHDILILQCKKGLNQKDISFLKKEKKVLHKLKNLKLQNIEKDLARLRSNFINSSVLQIIEKFLKLIAPYSQYTKNTLLYEKQYKEVLLYLESVIIKYLF